MRNLVFAALSLMIFDGISMKNIDESNFKYRVNLASIKRSSSSLKDGYNCARRFTNMVAMAHFSHRYIDLSDKTWMNLFFRLVSDVKNKCKTVEDARLASGIDEMLYSEEDLGKNLQMFNFAWQALLDIYGCAPEKAYDRLIQSQALYQKIDQKNSEQY